MEFIFVLITLEVLIDIKKQRLKILAVFRSAYYLGAKGLQGPAVDC